MRLAIALEDRNAASAAPLSLCSASRWTLDLQRTRHRWKHCHRCLRPAVSRSARKGVGAAGSGHTADMVGAEGL